MKTVLITGASSGIGLATAQLLAKEDFRVFGTARSLENRRELIRRLHTQHGDRLQWVAMDVTSEASVKKAVAAVLAKAETIDILICNAGSGIFGSIEEVPLDAAVKQFDINYFGTLRTLKAVLPGFREKRSGRIVLVSSLAGIVTIPYQAHYSATKFAIEALTEGLRQELRGFGIQASAVRPGDIETNFNDVTQKFVPEHSPYAKWSQPCWDIIDKNMKAAPQPLLVAKKIYKIINTKKPKAKYTAADFVSGMLPLLTPFMTSKIKEKILRIFYGVDFH